MNQNLESISQDKNIFYSLTNLSLLNWSPESNFTWNYDNKSITKNVWNYKKSNFFNHWLTFNPKKTIVIKFKSENEVNNQITNQNNLSQSIANQTLSEEH